MDTKITMAEKCKPESFHNSESIIGKHKNEILERKLRAPLRNYNAKSKRTNASEREEFRPHVSIHKIEEDLFRTPKIMSFQLLKFKVMAKVKFMEAVNKQ